MENKSYFKWCVRRLFCIYETFFINYVRELGQLAIEGLFSQEIIITFSKFAQIQR
jgi:hypothetical protein